MRLACIAVPHFRIALEHVRAAALRGRPVAIGEPPPGANRVVDCSPEAVALGVRAGMPLRDARTIAPDLRIVPPDPVYYDRSYEALLRALETAEPQIEPAEPGVAFAAIDQHAGEVAQQRAVSRLADAARDSIGVVAQGGVGEGKFIAWLAATTAAHGAARVVLVGDEAAFVAPLSAGLLPVSYAAQRKLSLYALRTIGDVTSLPIGAAQAQFGAEGRRLWELARGIDREPFLPRARIDPVVASLTMPAPTVHTGALIIAARQLIGRLLLRPQLRYRQVRQLRLRLALLDGGSWERLLTLREPTSDDDALLFVLKKLIEPLQLPGPVEAMSLECIGLTGETGKQRSLLFAEQARRRAQLIAAVRQLKTRFGGEPQVTRVVEIEPWSRIPERRYALMDYDL